MYSSTERAGEGGSGGVRRKREVVHVVMWDFISLLQPRQWRRHICPSGEKLVSRGTCWYVACTAIHVNLQHGYMVHNCNGYMVLRPVHNAKLHEDVR